MFPTKIGNGLVRAGQLVFAVIGIVALSYWASVSVNARLFQREEAHRFAQELQTKAVYEKKDARPESTTKVEQPAPVEGAVIAKLSVSRLGISTMVVEGVEYGDLKLAVGHIPGTALPGEPGNVGIAGHRNTFFRPLRLIHKDDVIALTTLHGEDHYRVVSTKIVGPDDVQVLYPTSRDSLTLVTCYPFFYVGSAPKRFIVRAERFSMRGRTATKERFFLPNSVQ
ncbi:MAG: class D sortase [Candidatus Acidiferrales bacterium]